MHRFLVKRINEQKCWLKLTENLRWPVKAFRILGLTESLDLTFNYFLAYFGVSQVCKLWIF